MFCGKCGAQNLDGTAFCKECGAPLNGSPSAGSGAGSVQVNQAAGKRNRIIGIAAVAVIAIVVVIVAVSLFGGRGYKSTVNKFIKATFAADGKTMVSLIPDEMVKVVCEEEDITKKEFIEYMTEELEDSLEYLDRYYDDWSYTYEITETEDYSSKALRSLKEEYEDEIDIKVKAAKTVTVEITITADDDTETSNSLDIVVIKVGNSWYIDVVNTSLY